LDCLPIDCLKLNYTINFIEMSTKIKSIDVIPIEIELNEPFSISVGSKIYLKNGLFGTGECGRYRSIHAETPQGVFEAGKMLAPLLIGQDVTNIRSCMSILDTNFVGNASIKCAFDMALYDLNAKILNIPLYQLLGGKHNRPIFTDMTVGLLSTEDMVHRAITYQKQGFPSLKIKLGDQIIENDISRVKAIRHAVGIDIPLRIDANQGWNYRTAKQFIQQVKNENIEYCEAPILATNFLDLRRLTAQSSIPIMGDESVFSSHDAYNMLATNCIDLLNIKLGKSGGIHHAMKIAAVAEAAGVDCQVGCFAETRVGISALHHFALVWPNIMYHDMDSPLMHTHDPVHGGIQYSDQWEVTVGDHPGHGASFDEDFLGNFDKFSCGT